MYLAKLTASPVAASFPNCIASTDRTAATREPGRVARADFRILATRSPSAATSPLLEEVLARLYSDHDRLSQCLGEPALVLANTAIWNSERTALMKIDWSGPQLGAMGYAAKRRRRGDGRDRRMP